MSMVVAMVMVALIVVKQGESTACQPRMYDTDKHNSHMKSECTEPRIGGDNSGLCYNCGQEG